MGYSLRTKTATYAQYPSVSKSWGGASVSLNNPVIEEPIKSQVSYSKTPEAGKNTDFVRNIGGKSHQIKDIDFNEETYISEFEKFTQGQEFLDSINKVAKSTSKDDIEETKEGFDAELQLKGENTIFESLAGIDKSKALQALLKKTKLSTLSGEIMRIAGFAKASSSLSKNNNKDSAMTFLISLDYLVKGLFTHWQITLLDESQKHKNTMIREKMVKDAMIMNHDIKYNILIGDQFHAKAYYMTTRLGNNELSKILTIIEENFAKIIFRDGYNGNRKHNLKKLYKDFYNYLPTFFGFGFKGIAIIYEMGATSVNKSFDLGTEYGFWIQFGIFSYIMSAIQNSENRQVVKTKLKKISSLVQLLSIETLQEILKGISILSYKDLKLEFAQLSMMHAHRWNQILDKMEVDPEVKDKMRSHISEFTDELVEITGLEMSPKTP